MSAVSNPFYAERVRKASKRHRCGCGNHIEPGSLYIEHTEYPGGDAGFADAAGHPVRMPECDSCARRYGRGDLLDRYPCPHENLRVHRVFSNIARDLTADSRIVSARCTACGESLTSRLRKQEAQ